MAIVATGSIAFDYILTFQGRFADHILRNRSHVINLSFLVDSVIKRRGGVAANYAYTLSLLGYPAAIIATVGEDAVEYARWLESRGVDCSGVRVLPNEQTATGYTTTDMDDAQITGYFGGAMLRAGTLGIDATNAKPEAVIIGPNAPDAMFRLVDECRDRHLRWVWDPAHQLPRMSRLDLEAGCRGAWIVIGNDYEMELIRTRTGRGVSDLLLLSEIVVTTFGREGSTISTRNEEYFIPASPVDNEADPVGAGDAYRAGLVFGLMRGFSVPDSGRIASVAASYVVEQKGTIEHSYTLDEFVDRFERSYGYRVSLRREQTAV